MPPSPPPPTRPSSSSPPLPPAEGGAIGATSGCGGAAAMAVPHVEQNSLPPCSRYEGARGVGREGGTVYHCLGSGGEENEEKEGGGIDKRAWCEWMHVWTQKPSFELPFALNPSPRPHRPNLTLTGAGETSSYLHCSPARVAIRDISGLHRGRRSRARWRRREALRGWNTAARPARYK